MNPAPRIAAEAAYRAPEEAGGDRNQGEGDEDERVGDDLAPGRGLALDHRQHRHPGAGVVVLDQQREGPEVRRGPEEDDPEREQRLGRQRAGRRGPADQRRHRACGAADDDVLRGQRLEPDRVDDHVAEQAGERKDRREHVHRQRQLDRRQGAERDPEGEPVGRLDPARDQRPSAGAGHARVALAVDVVVDRPGAAGREVAAEHRPEQGRELGEAALGDDHRRHRGQQQERDDPRLGQGDVVADGLGQRPLPREPDAGGRALHQAVAAPVVAREPTRSGAGAEAGSRVAYA